MKPILLVFIMWILWIPTQAKELTPAGRLKKLTYVLRGESLDTNTGFSTDLSEEEFQELYAQLADQYLGSDQFTETLANHVRSLFQMYIKSVSSVDVQTGSAFLKNNAFDNLLHKVISENRPWSELLTTQEYEASFGSDFSDRQTDALFFQTVFFKELQPYFQNYVMLRQEQISTYFSETKIPLAPTSEEQAQTLAGLVTTSRFFSRFGTTKINKNRKRAAALFKIFLCDPMKPVILPNSGEDTALLDKSLAMELAHGGDVKQAENIEAKHGTAPECMTCHYKLDPLAKVFSGSAVVLNPFSRTGHLVYKSTRGEKVNEEFVGFAGLADLLTKQDDYKSCQVEHFWNWIIGEDVPLNQATKQEVIEKFVETEGRPRDFIHYLVMRKEFYSYEPLHEEEIRYSHVQPIFKRCDSCHGDELWAPELSIKYPFDKFYQTSLPMVEQIAKNVDLIGNGHGATMPPKNAGWSLTASERDLLRAWIKHGAQDDNGVRQINEGSIYQAVVERPYELGFKRDLEPTYYNTFTRLIVGNALVNSLVKIFGINSNSCQILEDERNNVGFPQTTTGRPLFKSITPGYLDWWMSCLNNTRNDIYNTLSEQVVPEHLTRQFGVTQQDRINYWNQLSAEKKMGLVIMVEEFVFGPGIIDDKKRLQILSKVEESFDQTANVDSVLADTAIVMMSTRSFLTF